MTVISEIDVRLKANESGSNDYGGPSYNPTMEFVLQMQSGTGAFQADVLFTDERTIGAGVSDDIDLNGVLQGAFGQSIAMVELVGVCIINKPIDKLAAANTGTITIGGGSAPVLGFLGGTNPTIGPIGPGGIVMLASPDVNGLGVVTPTTADILRIHNNGAAANKVQVGLLGRTA